jgi:tetratricopeptide (TPR) repeat protein
MINLNLQLAMETVLVTRGDHHCADTTLSRLPHKRDDDIGVADEAAHQAADMLIHGQDEEAVAMLHEAIRIYSQISPSSQSEDSDLLMNIAKCQGFLGVYYMRKLENDSSLHFFASASNAFSKYVISLSNPRDVFQGRLVLASLQHNLGIVLSRLGRYQEAAKSFEICFEVRKERDLDYFRLARTMLEWADALMKMSGQGGENTHGKLELDLLQQVMTVFRQHAEMPEYVFELGEIEERVGDMFMLLQCAPESLECYNNSYKTNQRVAAAFASPEELLQRLDRTIAKIRLVKAAQNKSNASDLCQLFSTLNLWYDKENLPSIADDDYLRDTCYLTPSFDANLTSTNSAGDMSGSKTVDNSTQTNCKDSFIENSKFFESNTTEFDQTCNTNGVRSVTGLFDLPSLMQ